MHGATIKIIRVSAYLPSCPNACVLGITFIRLILVKFICFPILYTTGENIKLNKMINSSASKNRCRLL
jgi:hypothetical protein